MGFVGGISKLNPNGVPRFLKYSKAVSVASQMACYLRMVLLTTTHFEIEPAKIISGYGSYFARAYTVEG
jgi:hypothetical protein